jgi:hypothetical protein
MIGVFLKENPRELYSIEVVDGGFVVKFKEVLFTRICTQITRREFIVLLDIMPKSIENGVVSVKIILPFILFPNYAHLRINWDHLANCADQLQVLFWVLHQQLTEDDLPEECFLSQKLQLMVIETSSLEGHGCGMNVGLNQEVCERLKRKYPDGLKADTCEEIAFRFYFGMSSRTKREYEKSKKYYSKYGSDFTGIKAVVRPEGVPHFIVPGNCACLGANPDEFRYDHEMYSHNLDTTLQQMAMLASVVSFWNSVVKPIMLDE